MVLSGASSNKARRSFAGDDVVRLSTMDGVDFEDLLAVPSTVGSRKEEWLSLGDSGENEGNDVRDLSEIDDAELDM